MRAGSIRTRLLWREWRQGLPVVAALVVVPPLGFFIALQNPGSPLTQLSLLLAGFGAPLLTALWAGAKANRAAPAADFVKAHLPVRPLAVWFASFLIPLLIVALCGAWYGVCSEAYRYWHDKICPPPDAASSMFVDWMYFTPAEPAAMGAIFLASCFAVCHVIAMGISLLPAVLAGVLLTVWMLAGFVFSLRLPGEPFLPLGWLLPIAGAMASLAFTVPGGKGSLRVARGAVLCLAAGLLLPLVLQWRASYLDMERRRSAVPQVCAVEAADGSFLLEATELGRLADQVSFELRDRRSGTTQRRAFRRETCVIDVRDPRHVYLAQQLRGERRVRILVWESAADTVSELSSLPAGRNALLGQPPGQRCGHVYLGARHLVLALPLQDSREDLWLVDLRSGESALVFPDQCFASDRASWGEGEVILSGSGRAVVVDLEARRADFLRIPLREGEESHG